MLWQVLNEHAPGDPPIPKGWHSTRELMQTVGDRINYRSLRDRLAGLAAEGKLSRVMSRRPNKNTREWFYGKKQ
jgi:hypothetical protein